MSKLKVVDVAGKPAGEYEVPAECLEHARGSQAVRDVVINSRAVVRAGTASTLRKGEVAGSNKKPWKQKGTGRARAGLRQSPVWRGGGVAFGPHPRAYGGRLNKKVSRLAFRRAFTDKVDADAVKIVESIMIPDAKTRSFVAFKQALGIDGAALFISDKMDRNLLLAVRNVPGVELVSAREVSVYQLVRFPVIVLSRAAMELVKGRLIGKSGAVA
ncbi:MAG: 50S ribosomal protein L4 [Lentisphaerae bacterium RIFOXYC12_FULL_60_16]|nr:MAG: 50S ribosomal protein L4 [Lentisphaerae bacterium RIFOXYC12_FULL_60_16]OGV71148.1 MAG: 50S ribosomal protein L4 [Lentisphaerae bacterium RIFOXYA12_FULL_60_10]OGV77324.1 MAG: 50S ribosomal protein L4 [Lentisphaerae bacterium RIFOXYB12_FULL_60_10]